MKITNTHAALTGAALGAYTSDITDNPITGLASAGVGYGIGSLLALPQESLMEMAETLRIKQDSKYIKNRIQTGMSREQANFKSTFNSFCSFRIFRNKNIAFFCAMKKPLWT